MQVFWIEASGASESLFLADVRLPLNVIGFAAETFLINAEPFQSGVTIVR